MHTFGLIGAAGYIAKRHMQAIRDTDNRLAAATDPNDSVGQMDTYFPDAKYFREIELFERDLELRQRCGGADKVNFVSICTPNYLHDSHIRIALRNGANAICEKPLVLHPAELGAIKEQEHQYGLRVYTILQLRLVEKVQAIKRCLASETHRKKINVDLVYVTRRGCWYDESWKGDARKSGGPAMNIGVHFFDLLLWLFGSVEAVEVHLKEPRRMSGFLELEAARVRWFLSVDQTDLPPAVRASRKFAYRSLTLDGEETELSDGFTDLHTRSYQEILSGNGFGIAEARPAIELIDRINRAPVLGSGNLHPILTGEKSRSLTKPSPARV